MQQGKIQATIASWAENGVHVFCLAFFMYLSTIAPGATLWDACEFISCGTRLDIGHPPGAPLYWLILRLATMCAPISHAALACNVMSALCMASAATLLSLIFRHLTTWNFPHANRAAVVAGQTTAGLLFAFSSSVWASAIETEVYGAAALFAFLPLWLVLRWCQNGNSRLLLVALLTTGLASGIHWLSWTTLPASVGIVGHAWRGRKGLICGAIAGLATSAILSVMAGGGAWQTALWLDVLCVNTLGFPVGMGIALGILIFFVLVAVVLLDRRAWVRNTGLAIGLVALGFTPACIVFIRASQGVSMSISNPSDAQRFVDYLHREQYGHRDLIYGHTFASTPSDLKTEAKMRHNGLKYEAQQEITGFVYKDEEKVLFPRMQSNDEASLFGYRLWTRNPNLLNGQPTLSDELSYLMNYQMGHCFVRYFLWNFCGKQNDRIGDGGYQDGNYITGIDAVDNARLHDAALRPLSSGRITLFGIPMLLCLLGIYLMSLRGTRRMAFVVAIWALTCGPGLAFYLNMPPFEPRERDYIFLLFYAAMTLPVGFAIFYVSNAFFRRKVIALLGFALPLFVMAQTYSAVDRSGDTFTDNMAHSLLNLCPSNAILVVGGDNDTYHLWYAQNVHGERPDVTIVNYALLSTEWHYEQIQKRQRTNVLTNHSATFTPHGTIIMMGDTAISVPLSSDKLSLSAQRLLGIATSNPQRPICMLPNTVPTDDMGLAKHTYDLGPMQILMADTSKMDQLTHWRMVENNLTMPDATTYTPTADEIEQAQHLQLRHTCNILAQKAIERNDTQGAMQTLRHSLAWLPANLLPTDPELIVTAQLLAQNGERHLTRTTLIAIAEHVAAQLQLAAAIAPSDYPSAQNIATRISPTIEVLLPTLDATNNNDVAVTLVSLIEGLGFEL